MVCSEVSPNVSVPGLSYSILNKLYSHTFRVSVKSGFRALGKRHEARAIFIPIIGLDLWLC